MRRKVIGVVLGCFFWVPLLVAVVNAEPPTIPEIPKQIVRWASNPYFDQSTVVLGIETGFFKDVGIEITPPPYGKMTTAEESTGIIIAQTVDCGNLFSLNAFSQMKSAPFLKVFVYSNAFMGFAIVGKPEYKSFNEFLKEGYAPQQAMNKAISQLKGKTFAYPPEAGQKGWIELCFGKADMTFDDVNGVCIEDPKGLAMMVAGRADFQTSGVPAHVSLLQKGFKEIITNEDLVQYAKPSPESSELLAIGHAGWGALEEWIKNNHDTMLRVSSVLYRIMDLVRTNPEEAYAIHVPFVNSVAGTDFSLEDGPLLYKLNAFRTFEEQRDWFLNAGSPFYYKWNLDAIAKMWIEKGLWKPGEFDADDVCYADDTYIELLELRNKSETEFAQASKIIVEGITKGEDLSQAVELLKKAAYFYDARDYLDAYRFGKAANEWAKYIMQ